MRCGALAIFLLFLGLQFAAVDWIFTSPKSIMPDIVVMPESVIAASSEGSIYSLTSRTGALEWTYETGEPIDVSPCAVSGNEVAVALRSGKVIVISNTGKEMSSFVANRSPTSVACGGDKIFVASDMVISAWSSSGQPEWNMSIDSSPGALGLYGKNMYFTAGKRIYSVSSTTGKINWVKDAEDTFLSRPLEARDMVLLGTTDGRLYAYNKANGALRWSFLAGGWIVSTPTYYENTIYFGSTDGNLYAVSDFAVPIFKFKAGEGVWSTPLVHQTANGNIVAFGSTDGKLFGISSDTGNMTWSFSTAGRINSIYENKDSFVFTTDHGQIYSISSSPMCGFTSPREGEIVGPWIVEVKGSAHSDNSLSGVDVRMSGGSWVSVEGTDSWLTNADMAPLPDGPITLECRALDASGAIESGEYASLILIKMQNAPLRTMSVESETRVNQNQKFDIVVKDSDGSGMRGFTVSLDGKNTTVNSPYSMNISKGGPAKITITKPGYQPVPFVVLVSGDALPIIPVVGGIVLLLAVLFVVRMVFLKKS